MLKVGRLKPAASAPSFSALLLALQSRNALAACVPVRRARVDTGPSAAPRGTISAALSRRDSTPPSPLRNPYVPAAAPARPALPSNGSGFNDMVASVILSTPGILDSSIDPRTPPPISRP